MNTNERDNKWVGRNLNDVLAKLGSAWKRGDSRGYFQERSRMLATLPDSN